MDYEGNVFTAEGSPNIAFIKYWGKRDDALVLPCNSSLSMTFSHDAFRTVTSVLFSKNIDGDSFYLDGTKQDLSGKEIKERFEVLDLLRSEADVDAKALIVSKNYFPTASGLASSASGIATLVYAVNAALGLNLDSRRLSMIARQGSGSACRSIFGGIAVWHSGEMDDGKDSFAEQVFDEKYWPELIDNIVVVSQAKKKISSRSGMRQTVETNPLYRTRPESAEKRVDAAIDAYRNRDISALSEQVTADSNEMHALMLSTRPSNTVVSCQGCPP